MSKTHESPRSPGVLRRAAVAPAGPAWPAAGPEDAGRGRPAGRRPRPPSTSCRSSSAAPSSPWPSSPGAFCQAKAISAACEGISPQSRRRPAHPLPAPAGPDPDRDAGHLRPARHLHHPDGQVGQLRLISERRARGARPRLAHLPEPDGRPMPFRRALTEAAGGSRRKPISMARTVFRLLGESFKRFNDDRCFGTPSSSPTSPSSAPSRCWPCSPGSPSKFLGYVRRSPSAASTSSPRISSPASTRPSSASWGPSPRAPARSGCSASSARSSPAASSSAT